MSKKTLNQTNLESLGAEQLAALLLEVSAGSADIKRRLRLELSHNLGAAELAHDVRKRLVSLRKSTSFVGWRKRKTLVKELATQVTMIVEKVAPDDPTAAFDLLWQFVEMAPFIYGRVDDSKGDVGAVFQSAVEHFHDIGPRAQLDINDLADRVWTAILDNGYGEWDGVISLMAPTLGRAGLARLTAHVQAFGATISAPATSDHEAIQFLRQLRGDSSYADSRKARFVKECLQEIAAAAGDTDAYIAQFSNADLRTYDISSEVAQLLLAEGHADRALEILLNAQHGEIDFEHIEWNAVYVESLIALGRIDDAQSHRWACFTATLDQSQLRAYLKVLPDFEDIEAEDRARQYVLDYPNFSTALKFCVGWPDLLTAARLIETRTDEINGDLYRVLAPAADALRSRHPLASVQLWRSMIDCALDRGQSFRYAEAAEYLADCTSVDAEISDYAPHPSHQIFLEELQTRHDRKTSFWAKVR